VHRGGLGASTRTRLARAITSVPDIQPSGGPTTGPEHYAEAERLLARADRHTRGVTYDQEWTLTPTAAQVHATLALAAATAVGTAGPDGHAWADVAATR
jgi:hypothetical protein